MTVTLMTGLKDIPVQRLPKPGMTSHALECILPSMQMGPNSQKPVFRSVTLVGKCVLTSSTPTGKAGCMAASAYFDRRRTEVLSWLAVQSSCDIELAR